MKKTFVYAIYIFFALNCKEKAEEKPAAMKVAKETRESAGTGNWSSNQGIMNWRDAQAKCASIGMRLPTRTEIKAVYDAKLTEEWKNIYWTKDEFSDALAYNFNITNGDSDSGLKDGLYYVRCIRSAKETPKPNTGSGNWSAYQGEMNWNDAKAKCASIGMRLPTRAEFKAAYDAKLTEEWKNGLTYYVHWTNEEFSDVRAYKFDISNGNSYNVLKVFYDNVRCIR